MQKSFSDFVRDRRRQLNLTQRQVAEALGLKSIAFLSDIEAGNRKPSRDLLPALARILKTDIEILQAHDIRSPLAEVRTLLENHPEYSVAFRRVIEHSRDLGADEVLRRIEGSSSTHFQDSLNEQSPQAKEMTKSSHRSRRRDAPPDDEMLKLE